jgi:4-hydroxy-tetrahydrodipicolinate synthase
VTQPYLDESTTGVFIISATPFLDSGDLDHYSTDKLVDFYLKAGVHGMTILGMMGEADKLTRAESVQFMNRVLTRVEQKIPIVVGVSNSGMINLVSLAREAMDAGAAGVMVAPVPGLKTEAQLLGYFAALFDALGEDIPVCFQDYPQATGSFVSVQTLNRLIDSYPQFVMLKHEDCPGLRKLSALRREAEGHERRRVSILVGNGGLYFPLELRRGADGAMTGFAYPSMLVGVYERFCNGDSEGAQDLYDSYLPLVRYEQQPGFGLAVRKEILRRQGIIKSAACRAPGPSLDGDDHDELDHLIERLERRLRS